MTGGTHFEVLEARDERRLSLLQQRYQKVALLIVDELRFVPFERTRGELLFNLRAQVYERRSTIITTNLAFSEWVKVLGDVFWNRRSFFWLVIVYHAARMRPLRSDKDLSASSVLSRNHLMPLQICSTLWSAEASCRFCAALRLQSARSHRGELLTCDRFRD